MFQHSQQLEDKLNTITVDPTEICDLTSTSGFDNDGSTGPEMIENGIKFGYKAQGYNPEAIIFNAMAGETMCYQFGVDENDMLRRFDEAVKDYSEI